MVPSYIIVCQYIESLQNFGQSGERVNVYNSNRFDLLEILCAYRWNSSTELSS